MAILNLERCPRKRLGRRPVGRKVLLASGILSSLLYVAANVVGALRWRGYSFRSQTVGAVRHGGSVEATGNPTFL